jgi:aldehyde:ferredoxin oxidoreductase
MKYLGGGGIGAGLYRKIFVTHNKFFDPTNPLIFVMGSVVASAARITTIMSIVGKSHTAFPGG